MQLFEFVESNQKNFVLEKVFVPPPPRKRGNPVLVTLHVYMEFDMPKAPLTLDELRKETRTTALRRSIAVSEKEMDAAAHLYLF